MRGRNEIVERILAGICRLSWKFKSSRLEDMKTIFGLKSLSPIALFLVLFSSSNAFVTWEGNIRVTPQPRRFTTRPMVRSIAAWGFDTLHCVYYDLTADSVFYRRSTNKGETWEAEKKFSRFNGSYPAINCQGNFVYISYSRGQEIIIQRSTNSGSDWGTKTISLSPNSPIGTAIGSSGNNLYLVAHYMEDLNNKIGLYRSTDNGANWLPRIELGSGKYPSISVWCDTIHLAYWNNNYIYYCCSPDGGTSWSSPVQLSSFLTFEHFPVIDCRLGRIGVVWSLKDGPGTVWFRGSTTSGTSWGSLTALPYPTTWGRNATVSIGGYSAHIVYQDSTPFGNYELFYRRTSDNGLTWSEVDRLTNTVPHSINPSLLVINDSLLRLVWAEKDSIYFKRGRYLSKNVGVIAITSPPMTIDSGDEYLPSCTVYNAGLITENYWVRMKIGNFYQESTWVANHIPNTKRTLTFPSYAKWPRGNHVLFCSTKLSGDMYAGNDTLRRSITVKVQDVGVRQIVSPPDSVGWGDKVSPRVRLKNYGNEIANFSAKMTIGSHYISQINQTLAGGEEKEFDFDDWVIDERGTLLATCSIFLPKDINPKNDTLSKRTQVGYGDVGVITILQPTAGVYDSLEARVVIPRAKVKNYGSSTISFPVRFTIGNNFYASLQFVSDLLPDGETEINFAPCTLIVRGCHIGKCSTELSGDIDRSNDCKKILGNICVRIIDVGPTEIVLPRDSIQKDTVFFPKVAVKNFGFPEANFSVFYKIIRGSNLIYSESLSIINLPALRETIVLFPPTNLSDTGIYSIRVETELSGDCHPENNILQGIFRVYIPTSPQLPPWTLVAHVPTEPDYKRVKDGGSMVATNDALFILKGNNTRSLYRFRPPGEIIFIDSVPLGEGNKKVKKGAGMTWDGANFLYLVKGGNTNEFWRFSLNPVSPEPVWLPLPPIYGDKGLKGGTGITYLNNYVYLLKGSKTQEFYAYNTNTGRWEILKGPPVVIPDGSCLTTDGNLIYLLVGKSNSFYIYDPGLNDWIAKETIPSLHPQSGRRKKVRPGSSLLYFKGNIYALKGGNTQEFWKYDLVGDRWIPLELVPREPLRKGIGSGACLSSLGDNIFLLKGNNTQEIWRYDGTGILLSENDKRVKKMVKNAPPTEKEDFVRIYNTLGNLIYQGPQRNSSLSLRPGIYFMESVKERRSCGKKLVIIK